MQILLECSSIAEIYWNKIEKNIFKFSMRIYFMLPNRFGAFYLRWDTPAAWDTGIPHLSEIPPELWISLSNRLHENEFIAPRWDLTSLRVRSQFGGMIFLHVNGFSWALLPRHDCYLVLPRYVRYYSVKKCNSLFILQN